MRISPTFLNLKRFCTRFGFPLKISPSPFPHGLFPDGRVWVPDDPLELREPLLQDDPAHAEAGAAVAGVQSEQHDQEKAPPT